MSTWRADRFKGGFASATTGNSFLLHGFAPGSFVEAEFLTPLNTNEAGEDGEVAWHQSLDRRGKITFRSQQASTVNADISAQVALDQLDGTGYGTLTLLDENSGTLIEGTGRFEDQAKPGFGGGFQPREWVFLAEKLTIAQAGVTVR